MSDNKNDHFIITRRELTDLLRVAFNEGWHGYLDQQDEIATELASKFLLAKQRQSEKEGRMLRKAVDKKIETLDNSPPLIPDYIPFPTTPAVTVTATASGSPDAIDSQITATEAQPDDGGYFGTSDGSTYVHGSPGNVGFSGPSTGRYIGQWGTTTGNQ